MCVETVSLFQNPPDLMSRVLSIESFEAASNVAIDFSRRFMPEELTPLYHTRAYRLLDSEQRLRYNQLHALYFNEQTMFFEKALAHNVLGYFLAQPLPAALKSGLLQFRREEEQHSNMFRDLNRKCAPQIYSHQDFYFVRVPASVSALMDFVSKRPQRFPFLLWLMHLQEERALFFGRAFIRSTDALEPSFVETQRRHVADEVGHVRWDEALLDWVWPKTGYCRRQFNLRLFAWTISEFLSCPKRSALSVLRELARHFPELSPDLPKLRQQVLSLGKDTIYRKSLYSPSNVPRTFHRFDAWPEFQFLSRAMPGYVPGANP
jgi:hypothetical protein